MFRIPRKMGNSASSKASVFTLPYDLLRDVLGYVTFSVGHRPGFTIFVCTSITVVYLLLFSQKVQQVMASLPYEKYYSKFKSRKMITVYVTILEVFVEVLMAIVLAGVSVLITLWLIFEEVTDRKKKVVSEEVSREEILPPRESKIPVLGKNH